MEKPFQASLPVGIAAAVGAAVLASGWQIATRHGASTQLGPLDLALLRYGVPAVALAPLLIRNGLWPVPATRWLAVPIFLGAGLPFGLLAMAGARLAPVAHMGALLPGTMPLFAALLAAAILGERPRRGAAIGFAAIVAGVVAIAAPSLAGPADGFWRGDLLFLAASLSWAVFTIAFKRSGLDPWQATALLAAGSAAAALPLWLIFANGALAAASLGDVAAQFVWQGIVAGLGGNWTYALAIRHLGAARAALSGALVPAMAATGGALVLGEFASASDVAGIALTVAGTLIAGWPRRS